MSVISSRANPLFKHLRMLAGSPQRQRKEGIALLEGAHLADAYLNALGAPADAVSSASVEGLRLERCIVAQSAFARPDVASLLHRIEQLADRSSSQWGIAVTCFDDTLFEQISPVANGGVGLLLLVAVPSPSLPERAGSNCIVLDGVQDAGNVGSIFRSAAAAGVTQAFCMPGTANVWSTKVLRAAMGAHFEMAIWENVPFDALSERLDLPVAITDSHGTNTIYDADLSGALAWVFGNEGAGVCAAWRERAALRLTIPQPGRMESLNVAAAAAVCLFEQARQRRRAALSSHRGGAERAPREAPGADANRSVCRS